MNGADRKYFEGKFEALDNRMDTLHDDVLIIKTERKTEKRFMAVIAGAIALVVSTLTGIFWR